jgi:hypothetical protein
VETGRRALRNLTPVVNIVADLNNVLIPAWMIAFGVGLIRFGEATSPGERV